MNVKTFEDCQTDEGAFIPAGSLIEDVLEDSEYYSGEWSSNVGTYFICVPKTSCTEM